MKKLILILITISFTHFSFSQKKELKTVEKLIKSNNYTEAINILGSLNDLIDSADDKTKAKFYYLSGLANYQNGESSFENKLSSIENFNNAKEIEEEGSKIYSTKPFLLRVLLSRYKVSSNLKPPETFPVLKVSLS